MISKTVFILGFLSLGFKVNNNNACQVDENNLTDYIRNNEAFARYKFTKQEYEAYVGSSGNLQCILNNVACFFNGLTDTDYKTTIKIQEAARELLTTVVTKKLYFVDVTASDPYYEHYFKPLEEAVQEKFKSIEPDVIEWLQVKTYRDNVLRSIYVYTQRVDYCATGDPLKVQILILYCKIIELKTLEQKSKRSNNLGPLASTYPSSIWASNEIAVA